MNLVGVERVQAVLLHRYGIDRPIDHLVENWKVTGEETDQEIHKLYQDWYDEVTS